MHIDPYDILVEFCKVDEDNGYNALELWGALDHGHSRALHKERQSVAHATLQTHATWHAFAQHIQALPAAYQEALECLMKQASSSTFSESEYEDIFYTLVASHLTSQQLPTFIFTRLMT